MWFTILLCNAKDCQVEFIICKIGYSCSSVFQVLVAAVFLIEEILVFFEISFYGLLVIILSAFWDMNINIKLFLVFLVIVETVFSSALLSNLDESEIFSQMSW